MTKGVLTLAVDGGCLPPPDRTGRSAPEDTWTPKNSRRVPGVPRDLAGLCRVEAPEQVGGGTGGWGGIEVLGGGCLPLPDRAGWSAPEHIWTPKNSRRVPGLPRDLVGLCGGEAPEQVRGGTDGWGGIEVLGGGVWA